MSDSPAFTAASVQLLINPRMRSAFKQCKKRLEADQQKSEEFVQLAAVFRADAAALAATAKPRPAPVSADGTPATLSPPPPTPRFTLTFAQLQALSKAFRSTLTAEDAAVAIDADDDASPGRGFVHELIVGSSVASLPPARSGRVQDPAFKRYLEEQRWKQDRREYAEMVKDLPGNKVSAREADGIGSSYASASRDIGHGVNILTLMVTGFIVFYYVGSNLFPHNNVFAVMTGLLGLVGALMVEVCLFLVREQKQEMGEAQQVKMAKAQKRKEAETARRQADQLKQQLELKLAKIQQQQQQEAAGGEENKID